MGLHSKKKPKTKKQKKTINGLAILGARYTAKPRAPEGKQAGSLCLPLLREAGSSTAQKKKKKNPWEAAL